VAAFTLTTTPSAFNSNFTFQDGYKVMEWSRRMNTGDPFHKVLDPFKNQYVLMSCAIPETDSLNLANHGLWRKPGTVINLDSCATKCSPTGGTCSANNVCVCNPGFFGATCSLPLDNEKGNVTGYKHKQVITVASGVTFTVYFNPSTIALEDNNTMSFAIEANTIGWLGFGFSPNGNMLGSEAVIGWVTPYGVEHVKAYNLDFQDASKFVESTTLKIYNTSAYEFNGKTIIKFSRFVHDGRVNLNATTVRYIAAIGEGDVIAKHEFNRKIGSLTIPLLFPFQPPPPKTGNAFSIVFSFIVLLLALFLN
jgi:hypothetical protein